VQPSEITYIDDKGFPLGSEVKTTMTKMLDVRHAERQRSKFLISETANTQDVMQRQNSGQIASPMEEAQPPRSAAAGELVETKVNKALEIITLVSNTTAERFANLRSEGAEMRQALEEMRSALIAQQEQLANITQSHKECFQSNAEVLGEVASVRSDVTDALTEVNGIRHEFAVVKEHQRTAFEALASHQDRYQQLCTTVDKLQQEFGSGLEAGREPTNAHARLPELEGEVARLSEQQQQSALVSELQLLEARMLQRIETLAGKLPVLRKELDFAPEVARLGEQQKQGALISELQLLEARMLQQIEALKSEHQGETNLLRQEVDLARGQCSGGGVMALDELRAKYEDLAVGVEAARSTHNPGQQPKEPDEPEEEGAPSGSLEKAEPWKRSQEDAIVAAVASALGQLRAELAKERSEEPLTRGLNDLVAVVETERAARALALEDVEARCRRLQEESKAASAAALEQIRVELEELKKRHTERRIDKDAEFAESGLKHEVQVAEETKSVPAAALEELGLRLDRLEAVVGENRDRSEGQLRELSCRMQAVQALERQQGSEVAMMREELDSLRGQFDQVLTICEGAQGTRTPPPRFTPRRSIGGGVETDATVVLSEEVEGKIRDACKEALRAGLGEDAGDPPCEEDAPAAPHGRHTPRGAPQRQQSGASGDSRRCQRSMSARGLMGRGQQQQDQVALSHSQLRKSPRKSLSQRLLPSPRASGKQPCAGGGLAGTPRGSSATSSSANVAGHGTSAQAPDTVVFLDAEGVLRPPPEGGESSSWAQLEQIVRATGASLVLSGRGRSEAKRVAAINELLQQSRLPLVYDRLKDVEAPKELVISDWLEGHPAVTRWLVVDTSDLQSKGTLQAHRLRGHFVRVSSGEGLTAQDAELAVRLLLAQSPASYRRAQLAQYAADRGGVSVSGASSARGLKA